jgi:23S rRNA-intervening sequence protein
LFYENGKIFQTQMKKKTPNAERPTPNVEWRPHSLRISGQPNSEYESNRKQKYDLEDRLLNFAVDVVELTEALPSTRSGNHIAGQLLRCGTSPYGNHGEVESAESRKDFIHKLKICLKELPDEALASPCGLPQETGSSLGLGNVPQRSRGADPNFRGQRAHRGKTRQMMLRGSQFGVRCSMFGVRCLLLILGVGRWALSVGRLLPLPVRIEHSASGVRR